MLTHNSLLSSFFEKNSLLLSSKSQTLISFLTSCPISQPHRRRGLHPPTATASASSHLPTLSKAHSVLSILLSHAFNETVSREVVASRNATTSPTPATCGQLSPHLARLPPRFTPYMQSKLAVPRFGGVPVLLLSQFASEVQPWRWLEGEEHGRYCVCSSGMQGWYLKGSFLTSLINQGHIWLEGEEHGLRVFFRDARLVFKRVISYKSDKPRSHILMQKTWDGWKARSMAATACVLQGCKNRNESKARHRSGRGAAGLRSVTRVLEAWLGGDGASPPPNDSNGRPRTAAGERPCHLILTVTI